MKHVIYRVSRNKDRFYCIINGQRIGFYLTRSLEKIFSQHLKVGHLVDFEITDLTKKIGQGKYHQVSHFNKIESLNPYYNIYDLEQLRQDMSVVIRNYDYYFFIDFEMTMPGYKRGPFQAEIIQFGGVLTDNQGNVLLEKDYFVKPKVNKISIRTIKFLDLDLDDFYQNAKDFEYFYLDFKNILDKYEPKIVVWGRNDIIALNDSYKIHDLLPLTNEFDFFDLLTLHKDYFNLNQDLGLFSAYQTYFPNDQIKKQAHNAKDDAKITKEIFFEFIDETKIKK